MAKTKYGHYVLTDFAPPDLKNEVMNPKYSLILHADGATKFGGKNFSMAATAITEPAVMVSELHAHDYDQFLVFMGGDPLSKSLGGEAEICLGKEQEKHVIKTSAVVHIPKGLMHCPLTHKRVDKPYIFIDIILAPEYKRHSSK